MPELRASISPAINLDVVLDRTTTIRASFRDIQLTLLLSIGLVVFVVFVFLRSVSATVIPSVAVPLSLLGTFGGMYLLGYSLNNLSLMALTICTGFVVDDAIVVLENITRYIEQGESPLAAAAQGAREIGFTVLSMSVSLVAVFLPILLMGGLVGRLFREFAVTLTLAIGVSLLVSLTVTPMMCALLLKPARDERHGADLRASAAGLRRPARLLRAHAEGGAASSAGDPARHARPRSPSTSTSSPWCPRGSSPSRTPDASSATSRPSRTSRSRPCAPRWPSWRAWCGRTRPCNVVAFTGAAATPPTAGGCSSSLKPLDERKVVGRPGHRAPARASSRHVPGATLFLQAVQDVRVGGRMTNAQYQYTMQSPNLDELNAFAPRMLAPCAAAGAAGRVDRPAEPRPAGGGRHRPRRRLASRRPRPGDRRRPLRRLRPAPGLDHLHGAQPVPRRAGGGARLPAEPATPSPRVYVRSAPPAPRCR